MHPPGSLLSLLTAFLASLSWGEQQGLRYRRGQYSTRGRGGIGRARERVSRSTGGVPRCTGHGEVSVCERACLCVCCECVVCVRIAVLQWILHLAGHLRSSSLFIIFVHHLWSSFLLFRSVDVGRCTNQARTRDAIFINARGRYVCHTKHTNHTH